MKSLFIVLGIIAAGLLVAITLNHSATAASGRLDSPSIQIDDVRGDSFAMKDTEYAKFHPGECSAALKPYCTGKETYAGASASKFASFTSDGKLWQVSYSSDAWQSGQILTALKEKYGSPRGCVDREGRSCMWSNGKRTILFSHTHDSAFVEFTDENLRHQVSTEYNASRAAERKSDQ